MRFRNFSTTLYVTHTFISHSSSSHTSTPSHLILTHLHTHPHTPPHPHPSPFPVCNRLLSSGGYFMKNDVYYCSKDYHTLFGTKCLTCGEYVEGRVVTALGKSYHPHCVTCDRCK